MRRIGLVVLAIMLGLFLSIIAFRFVNPPITPVMVAEKLRGTTLKYRFVPLGRHRARPAARRDRQRRRPLLQPLGRRLGRGEGRGPGGEEARPRLPWREHHPHADGKEPLSVDRPELCAEGRSKCRSPISSPCFWPKERVIEVYLNIAQWGPGIFGAEAASQHYFRKSASQLTRREALLLAVSLPAPRLRNPGEAQPTNAAHGQGGRAAGCRILAARSGCVAPQPARQSASGQRRG